jgi:transposase
MSKIRLLGLSAEQKSALRQGYQHGKSHVFRNRCQLILLKDEGRSYPAVVAITKICSVSAKAWVRRYSEQGIEGLKTKKGRGRRLLLCPQQDGNAIITAVKANRQSLSAAKAAYEAAGGKQVSADTLRRFLKVLTADTEGLESGQP